MLKGGIKKWVTDMMGQFVINEQIFYVSSRCLSRAPAPLHCSLLHSNRVS